MWTSRWSHTWRFTEQVIQLRSRQEQDERKTCPQRARNQLLYQQQKCAACGFWSRSLLPVSCVCQSVWYCAKACQQRHYAGYHQLVCRVTALQHNGFQPSIVLSSYAYKIARELTRWRPELKPGIAAIVGYCEYWICEKFVDHTPLSIEINTLDEDIDPADDDILHVISSDLAQINAFALKHDTTSIPRVFRQWTCCAYRVTDDVFAAVTARDTHVWFRASVCKIWCRTTACWHRTSDRDRSLFSGDTESYLGSTAGGLGKSVLTEILQPTFQHSWRTFCRAWLLWQSLADYLDHEYYGINTVQLMDAPINSKLLRSRWTQKHWRDAQRIRQWASRIHWHALTRRQHTLLDVTTHDSLGLYYDGSRYIWVFKADELGAVAHQLRLILSSLFPLLMTP